MTNLARSLASLLLASALLSSDALAQYPVTTRVSTDSSGAQVTAGDPTARRPRVSADGRYVVFETRGAFVATDTNNDWDVYRKDVETGVIELVSVAIGGGAGDKRSAAANISGDGSVVVFESHASDLVPGGPSQVPGLYRRDMTTGTTDLIADSLLWFAEAWASADGRFTLFNSWDDSLTPGDSNGLIDVVLHDHVLGTLERVSEGNLGSESNGHSSRAECSADGRYVLFSSQASNLVAGDANGSTDAFLRDRVLGTTELVSVTTGGVQGASHSGGIGMSDDTNLIVFNSVASFSPKDTDALQDIYVRDRVAGTTELAVTNSLGEAPDTADCLPVGVSGDARRILVRSLDPILSPAGVFELYVHDRVTGITEPVYLTRAAPRPPSFAAGDGALARDGRTVVFASRSTNLAKGVDANGTVSDIYQYDLRADGATLTSTPLVAGSSVTFSLTGLAPSGAVVLAYSGTGQGVLSSPFGTLDLAPPLYTITLPVDPAGNTSISASLPLGLAGFVLFMQGVDLAAGYPTDTFVGKVQ